MAERKQYKIKWRDSDNKELARLVKNFNAKVKRVEKKADARELESIREVDNLNDRIEVVVPEKVSVKQLKELIKTRKDFNREIHRLERFLERGSEEFVSVPNNNLEITKWQRTEMNRMFRTSKKKANEKHEWFKSLEATSQGERLGYSVAQQNEFIGMGKAIELELKGLTEVFLPNKSAREVNKRFKSLQTKIQSTYYTDRDYAVRYNYIQGIYENYNVKDPNVADIIKHIEEMPIDEFMEIFYSEGGATTFDYASPKGYKKRAKEQDLEFDIKGAEYDSYLEALSNIWVFRKK